MAPRSQWGSRRGSTEFNPDNPYEAVSSTNVVGPRTAGAETGAYAPFGGSTVPGAYGKNDTGPVAGNTDVLYTLNKNGKTNGDNGNGNGNGTKTYDAWGPMLKPWERQFRGPSQPGYAPVTAGQGGRGMVSAVGQSGYDPFTFQAFQADPMVAQDYAGFQTTVDPFAYGQFAAPTAAQAAQDPGYQFRLEEGQRALQQSAAAKGMLRTGNTWKDLQRYGQGMATAEYDKVYGRRMGEHQLGYGEALRENELAYQRQLQGYGTGIQAQQLGEASRMGALQANLGVQAQQFGQGSQAWQQNLGARQMQYQQDVGRAQIEAQMAEAGANRQMELSLENRLAQERAYERDYDKALTEYSWDYATSEENQRKLFDRKAQLAEMGLRAAIAS
jgi:hypothetical protein